jgi:hypothetical protein
MATTAIDREPQAQLRIGDPEQIQQGGAKHPGQDKGQKKDGLTRHDQGHQGHGFSPAVFLHLHM